MSNLFDRVQKYIFENKKPKTEPSKENSNKPEKEKCWRCSGGRLLGHCPVCGKGTR